MPDVVPQDHDGRGAADFVRRLQWPAEQRLHPGERKWRRRDLRHAQGFEPPFTREHVALAEVGGAELDDRVQRPSPDREIVEH